VIAAGDGLRPAITDEEAGAASATPLAYPAGALARALPPGGLTGAFAVLPYWVPVAITPDALLDRNPGTPPGEGGPSLEEGFLRAWRGPFGWLVLAVPVGKDRREEMLLDASLAQLSAQRHDSPKAQLAERRARARHEELRESVSTGLWDIYLLAGATTSRAAVRVGALLAASLDLRGLPFGLAEREEDTGPLPRLLGATAEETMHAGSRRDGANSAAAQPAEPGPLARDVLGMRLGQDGAPPWGPSAGSQSVPPPPYADPASYSASPGRQGSAQHPNPPRPAQGSGLFPGGAGPHPAWRPESAPAALRAPIGDGQPEWPDPEPEFPCTASSLLLAALAVPPAREVPGIRLTLQPDFDVTPETSADDDSDAIRLGEALDGTRVPAGHLSVSRGSLNRHTFVCGATGSGKSQTVRHLLESATGAGIPWLVIEPAKAEYRLMAARLPNTQVITIRPGDPGVVPAGLNPLEPATGPGGERFPLQAHADLVRALFLAAFQAEEPFPQVLATALTRCYTEAGWDLINGVPSVAGASYPTLADLQAAALAVVNDIGYGQEVRDNIRGFVSVRIGSLRTGTTGRFLDGGFPLDYGRLLKSNVVLEIEDCGDDTDKAFLTGAVLIRLTEHLRMQNRFPERSRRTVLRHLTVIEEAHRLLRQPTPGAGSGAAAHAVEMFAGLLAEIRAYGEGLVIAEQIPSKLIPDAIKNTAVKIVHRLPAQDDRDVVGATMNLSPEQSAYLVTLVPGEASVFTDGMDRPILAKLPDGTDRELSGRVRAASPDGLVAARSTACPPDCGQAACTLRQVNAARNAIARDRRTTLWAELSVVAHLAGWAMPMPAPGFLRDLDRTDHRLRDCTLAQAVDNAVAARIPVMATRVAGPALAAHVTAAMRTAIDEGGWLCATHEPEWNAPAYMWRRILVELRQREKEDPGRGPHASTARWQELCGQVIPGDTIAAQAEAVAHLDAESRGDPGVVHDVMFGNREPSAIAQAVGASPSSPAWPERLATAVLSFNDCTWPLDLMGHGTASSGEAYSGAAGSV
jgi:hypothetical protein